MFKFGNVLNGNNTKYNLKWPYIPDHLYIIIIIAGSWSGLLNIIKEKNSDILTAIEKIYLYAKDLNEPKYQLLIKKHKDKGKKHLNDSKSFIEHTNAMNKVYSNMTITIQKESKKS